MLKLHFHPLASFCHKALIALYENGTPFEPTIIDFGDPAFGDQCSNIGHAFAHKQIQPFGSADRPAQLGRVSGGDTAGEGLAVGDDAVKVKDQKLRNHKCRPCWPRHRVM